MRGNSWKPFLRLNPTLFLEPRLERVGDLLGVRLGPAFNLGTAARFPVGFHPAANIELHSFIIRSGMVIAL
jgi:hypothetical protein